MSGRSKFALAGLILAAGEIKGRVKMQKLVYLLQEMGFDLGFNGFTIRQHGPYDGALASATDSLVSFDLVDEEEEDLGGINAYGKPIVRYNYRIKDSSKKLARKLGKIEGHESPETFDKAASFLNEQESQVLEVAATIHFLSKRSRLEGPELKKELLRLKGHLKNHFSEAEELLRQCDLTP